MRNTPPRWAKTFNNIAVTRLRSAAEAWLVVGEIDQHSPRTLDTRRDILKKLCWFLDQQGATVCGVDELRAFLLYVTNGHKQPGGRWNNPANVQNLRPVRPRTVKDYHGHIRTLFRWLVDEGELDESPMDRIPVPTARADQVQPFSAEQIEALLRAAGRSRYPLRDKAIVLFLLDTGLRCSELCDLRFADVDMVQRAATILGKGNKRRQVMFGKTAYKAVWDYLKAHPADEHGYLFRAQGGQAVTRSGLLQLIERLGKAASLESVRCSPHTFRHTFAIMFLRAGGSPAALQHMLGHEKLDMTMRYVKVADADIRQQHAQFSPVEALKRAKQSR